MMRAPDLWPLGQVLALVRDRPAEVKVPVCDRECFVADGTRELGVLVSAAHVPRWRVYRLSVADRRLAPLLWGAQAPETVTSYDYVGVRSLLAAGWLVD